MGEACSFLTLSVLNLIVERVSHHYNVTGEVFPNPENIPTLERDPDITDIVGDDVASVRTTSRRVQLHRTVAEAVGFVISPKNGCSNRICILCEDFIIRTKSGELRFLDAVKLRQLCNNSRDHTSVSDGVLGKSQGITQKLSWFGSKFYRDRLISLVQYNVYKEIKLDFSEPGSPWFLPRNCGGLGIPCHEIPGWGYKYINHLFMIFNMDHHARIWEFMKLNSFTTTGKHGFDLHRDESAHKLMDLLKTLEWLPLDEPVDGDSRRFIVTMEQAKTLLPSSDFGYLHLVKLLEEIDIIPCEQLLEQFDRIDEFQTGLSSVRLKKTSNRYKQWVRKSSRYWKRAIKTDSTELCAEFKDLARMAKRATMNFSGFVHRSCGDTVLRYGPSLRMVWGDHFRSERSPKDYGKRKFDEYHSYA
jgi:hypothetical protein